MDFTAHILWRDGLKVIFKSVFCNFKLKGLTVMKKKRSLAIIIAVVLAFGTGAIAKDAFEIIKAQIRNDFVIEIDGEEKVFRNAEGDRVYPILHDGTTYLPLRAIGEIIEREVYWYENEKRIELRKKSSSTVTDADVIITEESSSKSDNFSYTNAGKQQKKEDTNWIGKEKAKEIVLEKSNLKLSDISFIKVDIDKENGIYVYDVELKKGNKEYSAEIKADDGTILDWEVDFED